MCCLLQDLLIATVMESSHQQQGLNKTASCIHIEETLVLRELNLAKRESG